MKIETIQSFTSQDFDNLVEETYGRPYCYQQQDDCKMRGVDIVVVPVLNVWDFKNESIPEKVNGSIRGVSFAAWLARDPKQALHTEKEYDRTDFALELFWHRNFYPSVDMVLNDLHARGLLAAGKYQIVIDW